jgi:hypothetical protein
VVTREQEAGGRIGEDDVSLRVAGCRNRLEEAVADLELLPHAEPDVRVVPVAHGVDLTADPRPPCLHDRVCPGALQRLELREALLRRPPERRQSAALALPQADLDAEATPQRDRLGVVVPVRVRDQGPRDVAGPEADRTQSALQRLLRRLQCPPAVDEAQTTYVLGDVGVDGLEPVHGQRQGDPVHACGDLEGTGLTPGVTCIRSGDLPFDEMTTRAASHERSFSAGGAVGPMQPSAAPAPRPPGERAGTDRAQALSVSR